MILYSSTKVQLPKAFYKSIEKRSHWPRILLFIFIFPRHTSSYLWTKIDLRLLGCLANQKPQDKHYLRTREHIRSRILPLLEGFA